jgi:hypothetical protein
VQPVTGFQEELVQEMALFSDTVVLSISGARLS